MPATSTATHNDHIITFTEEGHTYRDQRGCNYTSVTTFLKSYFEPFDPEATAARMEAQGRGDAADLRANWKAKGEAACHFGTRVHETAEAILNAAKAGTDPAANLPHSPESDREKSAFRAVWDYCTQTIIPNCQIIGTEILVFHPRWYIAGTIDLAVKLPNGTVSLLDWKTNERIDRTGFNGKTCLPPISHLQDCHLTKYALQLAVYREILTDAKYLPRSTTFRHHILHIDGGTVTPIETPALEPEALRCILDHTHNIPF